jgi:hypothetical protein
MLLLCVPDTRADNYTNWTKVLTFTVRNFNFCVIYKTLLLIIYESIILSIKQNSVITRYVLCIALHHSILVNVLPSNVLIHSISGVNKQQLIIGKPIIFTGAAL